VMNADPRGSVRPRGGEGSGAGRSSRPSRNPGVPAQAMLPEQPATGGSLPRRRDGGRSQGTKPHDAQAIYPARTLPSRGRALVRASRVTLWPRTRGSQSRLTRSVTAGHQLLGSGTRRAHDAHPAVPYPHGA
jgi:hypothetical protein